MKSERTKVYTSQFVGTTLLYIKEMVRRKGATNI